MNLLSCRCKFIVSAAIGMLVFPGFLAFAQSSDKLVGFQTLAALRAFVTSGQGSTQAFTAGYYAPGDDGGNHFYWSASSVATDNGGTVIKPDAVPSPSPGRWLATASRTANVRAFGAYGDGNPLHDDATAFNKAIASLPIGGGTVFVPEGTYIIGSAISTATDNIHLKGAGTSSTVLTPPTTPSSNIIFFSGDNWSLSDLTVDSKDLDPGSSIPSMTAWGDYWQLHNVNVIRYSRTGIACMGNYWKIEDCLVSRSAVSTDCDHGNGILVTPQTGSGSHGLIKNNTSINGTIVANGPFSIVEGNTVTGFGCGAGIVGGRGDGQHSIFSNNIITGGRHSAATDYPQGIQNWMAWSVINGNNIYNNDGAPISQGGRYSLVLGNNCTGNGLVDHSGISTLYLDTTYNGSYSVFAANLSNNNGGGMQDYGYEETGSATHIRQIGNNYNGNTIGQTNSAGAYPEANLPGLFHSEAWSPAPGLITDGSSVSRTVTVPGAALGDFVDASYSVNLQGVSLFGSVTSPSLVTLRMENHTGGQKTIGVGTVSCVVRKGSYGNNNY